MTVTQPFAHTHTCRSGSSSSLNPYFLNHLVLGKFIDYRNFSETRIQKWVSNQWIKFGIITVQKLDNIFLFLCEDIRDKDAMLQQGSAAYQAALLIFTSWTPGFMEVMVVVTVVAVSITVLRFLGFWIIAEKRFKTTTPLLTTTCTGRDSL